MTITKKEMCHLLYCLNWHIKIRFSAAGRKGLSESEREVLRDQTTALKALKGKVLAKLVYDGYATIRSTQNDTSVKHPSKYYSIRLNRDFSFHSPIEEFKELLDEEKKTRDICPSKAQGRNF